MGETETPILCPACDCYHDGPDTYCRECQMDFQHMLESGEPEIMLRLAEYVTGCLTKIDFRPETMECPKCGDEIIIV